MNYEIFLDRVRVRAGLENLEEAERVAQTAIAELGPVMVPRCREVLAADLPAPLAGALLARHESQRHDLDAFYRRVAEREGVGVGFGMEHAQVVCQALAMSLTPPQRQALRGQLPAAFCELFEALLEAARSASVPARPVRHGRARSLSSGRPFSARTLADAQWGGAHRHSVARSDNPHADSKLSSGSFPRAQGAILASGRPGSARPLSDYKG